MLKARSFYLTIIQSNFMFFCTNSIYYLIIVFARRSAKLRDVTLAFSAKTITNGISQYLLRWLYGVLSICLSKTLCGYLSQVLASSKLQTISDQSNAQTLLSSLRFSISARTITYNYKLFTILKHIKTLL